MVRVTPWVATAFGCLLSAMVISCGSSPVQVLSVPPEGSSGSSSVVVTGQGILVIRNDSETLPVTCVLIRESSFDLDNPNLWGVNRLPGGNPIGPGEEVQITLAEGLYDLAVVRPSEDPNAVNNDETDLEELILVAEGKLLVLTVNDFSFSDIDPSCN